MFEVVQSTNGAYLIFAYLMHIFRQLNDTVSDRVLSSQAAKDAITALQNIINGGLQNEINNLNQQGNQLKDPNNWDGPLAERFRNDTWPGVENTLRNLTQELTDLREQLNQISTDIFQAGGGA